MAFTMITLDTGGGYRLADGSTPRAVLHATPYVPMVNGTEVVDQTVSILLDSGGLATKAIAATTDTATTPAGNAYRLRIEVDGRTVHKILAAIPHNTGATVNISSLIPLDDPPDFSPAGGYTDEQVDDRVNALIVAGANITKTYDDTAGTLTIAAATTGASGIPASTVDAKGDLIAGTANDTVARLAVGTNGLALVAASGQATGLQWAAPAPASHNHAASDVTSGTVATARLGSGTADSTTFLRGDQTWATPAGGGSGSGVVVLDATEALPGGLDDGVVVLRRATVITPPAPSAMATLTDSFATADTAKWTFGTGTAVTGGQLVVTPSAAYPEATSVNLYDLTGSYFYAQVNTVTNAGTGTIISYLGIAAGADQLYFQYDGFGLGANYRVSGTDTNLAYVTYNGTSHRWWRVREASGTVYWEVSTNGSSWSAFASVANPFGVTSVHAFIGAGFYGTEPSPGTLAVDLVNGG